MSQRKVTKPKKKAEIATPAPIVAPEPAPKRKRRARLGEIHRTDHIGVRVSADEKSAFDRAIEAGGYSVTAYLRALVLAVSSRGARNVLDAALGGSVAHAPVAAASKHEAPKLDAYAANVAATGSVLEQVVSKLDAKLDANQKANRAMFGQIAKALESFAANATATTTASATKATRGGKREAPIDASALMTPEARAVNMAICAKEGHAKVAELQRADGAVYIGCPVCGDSRERIAMLQKKPDEVTAPVEVTAPEKRITKEERLAKLEAETPKPTTDA